MKRYLLLGMAFVAAAGARDFTSTGTGWQWRGQLPPGHVIEIGNVTGDIRAVASTGREVEIAAIVPQERRSEVELHVASRAGGLTVCAVRSGDEICPTDGATAPGARVDYEVRVPAGVGLVARTVNGGVTVDSLASDVDASTVNGSVVISTTGTAKARTINGSIRASLLRAFWPRPPEFSAVNGGISVRIPRNVRTSVRAETRNGKVVADLVGFCGTATDKALDGQIGGGGDSDPMLIQTLNGGIELQQRF